MQLLASDSPGQFDLYDGKRGCLVPIERICQVTPILGKTIQMTEELGQKVRASFASCFRCGSRGVAKCFGPRTWSKDKPALKSMPGSQIVFCQRSVFKDLSGYDRVH